MKAKFIYEDLKVLKGPSEEEINKQIEEIKNSIIDEKLSERENYQLYQRLIMVYPHVKTIMEDIYGIYPNYRIDSIRKDKRRISFWIVQSGSCTVYYNNIKKLEVLEKYRVMFQVPGNQEYSFSISMNTEIEKEPEYGVGKKYTKDIFKK